MHTLRLLKAAHNEEVWLRRQRRKSVRRNLECLNDMPELLFREYFQLDKVTFRQLCTELRSQTELRGSKEIPLETKVLCALSFFATGSHQKIVGVIQSLTQRTTSRCINQVIDALNHPVIVSKWIVLPQTQQGRTNIEQEFQTKHTLPGIIGCIDCTHINIVKPNTDDQMFLNPEGYHSLNVQMICDSNMKIMNVNTNYGGATHDSLIWSSSEVEPYMRRLHQNGEQVCFLGDSAYPLRPWLLTPILDAAPGSKEETFTTRHIQARNCIKQCFGLLKARWRCLLNNRTLHYHPNVVSKIVVACSVLHNMALNACLPAPTVLPVVSESDQYLTQGELFEGNQNDLQQGKALLKCLVNRIE